MTPFLAPDLVLSPATVAPACPDAAAAPDTNQSLARLALIGLQCVNRVARAILDAHADREDDDMLQSDAEGAELVSRYCGTQLAAYATAVYGTPFDTRADELESALRLAVPAPAAPAGDTGAVRLRRLLLTALSACLDVLGRLADAHVTCDGCAVCQDLTGIYRAVEGYQEVAETGCPGPASEAVHALFGVDYFDIHPANSLDNSGKPVEWLKAILLQTAREVQ
jgi:hypothetical protein